MMEIHFDVRILLTCKFFNLSLYRVNCSFYFKIGACRHGERCSRKHVKPTFSQTILCSNIYQNPAHDTNSNNMTDEQIQAYFDDFYEDFFTELCKYGEVEEMHVCDNVGDHLIGNVYARFRYEEDAQKAVDNLNQRFYAGIYYYNLIYCLSNRLPSNFIINNLNIF